MENLKSKYFMGLALMQADKALGKTKTNPAVGCVIVKNNNLISAAHTSHNGRPHAEHNALKIIKKNDANLTLYSTLEPCSHYGKTSPCVKKIINKKIRKVYFSIKDPDFRSYNKCRKILSKRGTFVSAGVLKNEIGSFYRSYIKNKRCELPFVTCKLAVSKDFFTITNAKKKWITNEYSRGRVHLMRSRHDCILTSANTIIKDNSRLNCRIEGLKNLNPARIILDKNLKSPINSKIFADARNIKTFIFYNKTDEKKIKSLNKIAIKHHKISLDYNNNLDLRECLLIIKKLGFARVFVESGLKLTNSLLGQELVDEFKLFISDKNLNNLGAGSFKKSYKRFFRNKKKSPEKINLLGDKLISYNLNNV